MFGSRLNEIRKQQKMTLEELADLYNKRFNGGLNKGTLSKYENGKQEPMISVVDNLSTLLGVPVDYLLGKDIISNESSDIKNYNSDKDVTPYDFYVILQQVMDEQGISIPEVARKTGLADSTVRSIISRKSKTVALEVAFKISSGLGVSLERLNGIEVFEETPIKENESTNMMDIMQRIKNRRTELNMSYQDLADKTGMSKSTLQRYETGNIKNMPLDKLEDVAKALQISPAYLMGWEEVVEKKNSKVSEKQTGSVISNDEEKLLSHYRSMNSIGQQKAIDNISDLVQIPSYQVNKTTGATAAHGTTAKMNDDEALWMAKKLFSVTKSYKELYDEYIEIEKLPDDEFAPRFKEFLELTGDDRYEKLVAYKKRKEEGVSDSDNETITRASSKIADFNTRRKAND